MVEIPPGMHSGLVLAPDFPGDEFDETGLLARAEKEEGLSDWGGDDSFRIGLRKLIEAVVEMDAGPQARTLARGRILHLLATRLHFVEDAKLHPEIETGRIERPLVVIGLPRTGTTVLYDLLARDPAARTPRDWEYAMPWPAPEAGSFDSDPRIGIMNDEFKLLLQFAPELGNIQRFSATEPSEDNLAFTHHFASTNFFSEIGAPSYAEWLDQAAPIPGKYATHKRLLQQLQWKGPRGRWTIKSPEHLFELDSLLAAYPDACLVWTHRDPVSSLPSLSSMVSQFWRAAHKEHDQKALGPVIAKTWTTAITRAMESRKDPRIEARIIDIAHQDVVGDPIGSVKTIYERFDLPFTDDYADRMARFIAEDAGGGRLGRHQHTPEQFGLTAEGIQRALPTYYERFGGMIARPYPKR